jgi:hypothetical protein
MSFYLYLLTFLLFHLYFILFYMFHLKPKVLMTLRVFLFFTDEESRSLNHGTQIHFLVGFYVCHMYKYFLGFLGKTSSSIFVRSHARK